MRVVFIGASELAVHAASLLINRGDQVVIIEKDKEKIDDLSDELDCSFLHGDASKPAILNETAPEKTSDLIALSPKLRMRNWKIFVSSSVWKIRLFHHEPLDDFLRIWCAVRKYSSCPRSLKERHDFSHLSLTKRIRANA